MSERHLPFDSLPDYPGDVSATSVVVRLIDGLGFRFRWATDGLSDADVGFRPGAESHTVEEITGHIWGLVNWVNLTVSGTSSEKPGEYSLLRGRILEMLWMLRSSVLAMDDDDLERCTIEGLPFWHIINGPLSDALTHVGQINAFRRLSGNPTPEANVFRGLPPAAEGQAVDFRP
jgi:hypothetical protein